MSVFDDDMEAENKAIVEQHDAGWWERKKDAELARLRAENERLKAALKPVTRDQINVAVIEVMAQAQSFASSWSLVGGRYDSGDMLDHAHKQKSELERMVRAAIDAAMASGKV